VQMLTHNASQDTVGVLLVGRGVVGGNAFPHLFL